MDDRQLLVRVGTGDRAALTELYQRHRQMVMGQLALVTNDPSLNEEILQDTMLAVWHGASRFRGESTVRSWIVAIARRQARDRLRRHRLVVVPDGGLAERPGSEPDPEQAALGRVETEALIEAMGSLPLANRELLGLTFGAGLSLGEVASVLDIPVGTVKSRLAATRVALRDVLSEKGYQR